VWLAALVTALALALVATPAVAGPAQPPEWSAPLPGQDQDAPPPAAGTAPAWNFDSAQRLLVMAGQPPPSKRDLDGLRSKRYYPAGTYQRMLASWRDGLNKGKYTDADWPEFVRGWVDGVDDNNKGVAFEQLGNHLQGITGSKNWSFNTPPPGASNGAKPDANSLRPSLRRSVEYKAGSKLSDRSQAQLGKLAENVDKLGIQGVVVFGEPPDPTSRNLIDKLNRATAVNKARLAKGEEPVDAIVARYQPWTPQPVPLKDPYFDQVLAKLPASASAAPSAQPSATGNGNAPATPGPKPVSPQGGGVLVAPGSGQLPVSGALAQALEGSPDSPRGAAVEQSARADLATDYGNPDLAVNKPLGGVDFSTLELRYVSDTYQGGSGLRYAFSAGPEPAGQTSYGGRLAARRASDSFFVWLELPTSDFTVNLNPDEPNRIIDAKFGSTDAGRILLQADLQMKKTVAKLIHPDTPGGAAFWAALQGDTKCLSMRQWIVPAPATVRQDGDQLYILDAPLQVKLETDYVKSRGVAGNPPGCQGQNDADTRHNEAVFRSTILPQVQKAVNTAPEYADLRRVYVSRIAAQWYRERSASKPTAYSDLIDKGDVSAWPATVTTTPQDVFNQYVESYTKGEFNVTHTTRSGNTITTNTYVFGGVDFSTVPRDRLGASAFGRQRPALPTAVSRSEYRPVGEPAGTVVWLGGESTARPLTEIQAGVPSPARTSTFWLVLTAPVALWVVGGGLLLLRRRRRRPPPPAALAAGP
jgi:hypothetical protein